MDPDTLRAETPAFRECCFLNTGASGPSPRRVVEGAVDFERQFQYEIPCGRGMYDAASDELERTRDSVADLLGTHSDRIALTQSTVDGINQVATAIDWQPGDVVVQTDLEHPAGELPWKRMSDLRGVERRIVPTDRGRLDIDAVKTAVENARLVCLSSVTWNHGTRLPVRTVVDIAHDAGAEVLVDAVQSPGQMPVDVEAWGADYVAASGHKWLLGLWGGGFLYVSDPTALEPQQIGYFSIAGSAEAGGSADQDRGADYRLKSSARRFELGTSAIAQQVALRRAIETVQGVGIETIERRIERLSDRLKDGLGDRLVSPRDARSGLVTFSAENPETLADRLAGEGIQIRWLPDPYACRASVHALNTAADIDRLLEVLD